MGWLGVVLSVTAAWFLRDQGWPWLAAAIAVGVLELWSWGLMHNHAVEYAKQRPGYTGGFFDITPRDASSIPDWVTNVNMLGFVAAVGLLIAGLIL